MAAAGANSSPSTPISARLSLHGRSLFDQSTTPFDIAPALAHVQRALLEKFNQE